MISHDADFEALKALTRMSWMIGFEAVATVATHEHALQPRPPGKLAH